MASYDQATLLAILEYWHKVEFFVPYGLEQYLDDLEEWQSKTLLRNRLESTDTGWLTIDVPEDKELLGYNLFLGVFDKSSISQICECIRPSIDATDSTGVFEEEARADLEGMTCFAKLPLDRAGYPIIDSISISTAPWALGQTLNDGLNALNHDAFDSAQKELKMMLRDFMSERGCFADKGLDASEVLSLQALLCRWAGFTPSATQPIAAITAKVKARTPVTTTEKASPEAITPDFDDDEEGEAPEEELDILNSFYIRDIERAINSVRTGDITQALGQYLIPLATDKRIDLYSREGCSALLQALRPRLMNPGHWMADPGQPMSLMQQFALNQIGQDLERSGLFSVNGPPGTGKTTLLRDLFADNIVQRTRILAGLAKADDAFEKHALTVRFKSDSSTVQLRPLINALTGFEMVVASTNNAAVENISVDLVKRKALGEQWRHFGYLQPIAHNMAIEQTKRGNISPEGDQMPWGLISCALGNSTNRRNFNERFSMFSLETSSKEKAMRIWEWFDRPNALTFNQACEAFKEADRQLCEALDERERLAELLDVLSRGTEADYVATAALQVKEANSEVASLNALHERHLQRLQVAQQNFVQLTEEQRLIDRTAPGWWARLWRTKEAKAYFERRKLNANSQLHTHEEIRSVRQDQQTLVEKLRDAMERVRLHEHQQAELAQQWQRQSEECEQLLARLGKPHLPADPLELRENDRFQIEGLWHDRTLAELRSSLFAAALALQQAWLHTVGQKRGALRKNLVAISALLSNKTPEDPSHALPIWQNLFMVVPVVSSTFASFAKQFAGLGPNALGWVFIDEAGQAVPQAAVGALWRAQRCVVVGDPLQIEPVFTLPTPLLNALGELNPVTASNAYAPHCVSVQRLADQANRFGAYAPFLDETIWVGSPLRVHRRCHEPMFTLANRIAYDNKMVYGLPERNPSAAPLIDLPSGWVDIRGAVERKQVVPEQIEFMIKVIVSLFHRDTALPELYVISPFKAIRTALREGLLSCTWKQAVPKRDELKRWLKRSVGTVHTFQGKEEKTVFMLLGTDMENAGGATWASSKPNLLNVALTRAQHRIYLVGDIKLWGALPYFEKAVTGDVAIPRWRRRDFGVIVQSANAQERTDV